LKLFRGGVYFSKFKLIKLDGSEKGVKSPHASFGGNGLQQAIDVSGCRPLTELKWRC